MRRVLRCTSVAAVTCVCAHPFTLPAQTAADASSRDPLVETKSEGDHLTGDWGGWRSRLVDRGIHFQGGYIGEAFGNVSGGIERGAVYEGLLELALELDLERLTGWWRGGAFRISSLYAHGRSPSRELIGDLQTASNIDAYDSMALYELWFEQKLFSERVSLRAGQLLADTEFATTDYGGALLNSAFGWPGFISGNTRATGPAFFRAAPGVRVHLSPGGPFYVQAGVYDGDSFDDRIERESGNPSGTNFRLAEEQGMFGMAEAGWHLHPDHRSIGLPGTYKIGGWWHTADFPDQYDPSRTHTPNYGVYLAAQQMVWREPSVEPAAEGLGLFFRLGISPADRNVFPVGLDAGAHYQGLLPGRGNDILALGAAWVDISDDRRQAEREAGIAVISDYELALELSYQCNLKPWLTVQPDLQWIHHPGGSGELDDAFVLGLRCRITF